jgi:hypothetical protein
LFVIDAEKCFGPPPPGETVLQNGDSTATTPRRSGYRTIVVYRVIVGSLRGGASLGATGAKPHFIFGDQKKRRVDFRKEVCTLHS